MTLTIPDPLAKRLGDESIVWLTTIDPQQAPVPTPIWFLWDGEAFLFFSQPDKAKLRNIAANPTVALNLNTNASGGDVAVFAAEARVDESGPTSEEWAAYVAKYGKSFGAIGTTVEGFHDTYSVFLRITPTRVRFW